nr:helix-turn-helix transcriptional regulator [uncultured Oscillibacter sp.]
MFSQRKPTQANRELFGQLIHDARKSQNMTQEKLAECMTCSLRWINRVERGESNLNWMDMIRLLIILDLPPEKVAEEVGLDVSILTSRK